MLMTLVLVGTLCAAIALILSSAWLVSNIAYGAILVLVATVLVIAEMRGEPKALDLLTIGVDLLFYCFVLYFVTVQKLMRRRVSQLTSRDEFRAEMESRGVFRGLVRTLYYLPAVIMLLGIVVAIVGAIGVK